MITLWPCTDCGGDAWHREGCPKGERDMDKNEIERICDERLESWKKILVNNMSTPVILIGVGHGKRLGQIHVITCEGLTDKEIETFIHAVIKKVNL